MQLGGKRRRFDDEEEDDEDDDIKPKKKRGRPLMEKNPPNPPNFVNKMRRIINEIVNFQVPYLEEGSESDHSRMRNIADAFLELPSRKELPDYYELIRRPLDIKKIRNRINNHKYRSLDELREDFFQMCINAQTYNMEQSQIYEDSIMLQKIYDQVKEKVEAKEAAAAAAAALSTPGSASTTGDADMADDVDDELVHYFSLIGVDTNIV